MSQTSDRPVAYWDCEQDNEELFCTEIEEAITLWADNQIRPLPETVTVYGFAREELPDANWIARHTLEHLFEWMDDEHGNPNEDTVASDALYVAALQFAETFRKEYTVWRCKEVTSMTVKVADYYTVSE